MIHHHCLCILFLHSTCIHKSHGIRTAIYADITCTCRTKDSFIFIFFDFFPVFLKCYFCPFSVKTDSDFYIFPFLIFLGRDISILVLNVHRYLFSLFHVYHLVPDSCIANRSNSRIGYVQSLDYIQK